MVLCLCFIFPVLHASLILFLALGVREAVKTILTYPALVILPAFTCLTFGPVSETGCIYQRGESRIQFSWRLTWVSVILTFCGAVVASVVIELNTGHEFYYPDLHLGTSSIFIWAIFILSCCQIMSCCQRQFHMIKSFNPLIQSPIHSAPKWFQKVVYDTAN